MKPPAGTRAFATALGEVWLAGEDEAFDGDQPVVLAIAGAFAEAFAFDRLAQNLPEAAVLVARLPGDGCPPLAATSVGAFAAAYSEALDALGRPALVCGSSIGALVGLAMRARSLRALVALEPPLETAKLWPLIPRLQARLATHPQDAEFIATVFGVTADSAAGRSYLRLLDSLVVPTWCLLGAVPLMPPRDISPDPSFVDESERAALRAHRMIRIQEAPRVGHNLPGEAGGLALAAIRALLPRLG